MAEQLQVEEQKPQLVRQLTAWDAGLLTIGSVLGTGIFITTGDIARVLPHPGLIVLVWVLGGIFTLAGALTYAELGGMFPRAGGQYQYLKEAYGIFWAFLFGWGAFWVIMTGGISALAVGFGQYFGAFVPFFSTDHVLFSLPLGFTTWNLNGGQLAGGFAIVLLTFINYLGLKEGAGVQNFVTWVKIVSIVGLALLGLFVEARVQPQLFAPLPTGSITVAMGVALIAVLWSYDGWYGATNVAGEMHRPERNLPIGLIGGTAAITILYVLMNLFYVNTLSVEEMGQTGRIAETASTALFGPIGGRIVTAAVLISTFGCISATILYAARIYLPMAQDGVFFPSLARIHPKHRTPSTSIVAQGIWAFLLTFSGSYEQLYTFVVFVVIVFHLATGIAVFVLRRTRPDAPRPYRTWGYPVVPIIFILSSALLVANTLFEKPVESLIGVAILALGIPAYYWWRKSSKTTA
jgi:APA family basic amino acid/polyamine antiporter